MRKPTGRNRWACAIRLFVPLHRLDDDVLLRGVWKSRFLSVLGREGLRASLDGFDLIDDIHAIDDFAEYSVTGTSSVAVKERVVNDVNKELGRSAVWIVGTGHG